MSSTIWLLVEWMENDIFNAYSVVNYDSVVYKTSALQEGITAYIRENFLDNPRQGKILRISDNKLYVQEHKQILEQQNQQYKMMVKDCLQNIKEIKEGRGVTNCAPYIRPIISNQVTPMHVMTNTLSVGNNIIEPGFLNCNQEATVPNVNNTTPRVRNWEPTVQPVRYVPNSAPERPEPLRSSTPLPVSNFVRENHFTSRVDKGTQTKDTCKEQLKKLDEIEQNLIQLQELFYGIITELVSKIENAHNEALLESFNGTGINTTDDEDRSGFENDQNAGAVQVMNRNALGQPRNNASDIEDDSPNRVLRIRRMSTQITSDTIDTDMIPIGNGNAKVPKSVLKHVNWNSYSVATRQLLQAVFPRSVLASHCLTGKRSPAFMNRPAKKILDPKLVEDIVKIVSTRCGVPKSLVRNSITIKCTDEAKLYRNRQAYKEQRKKSLNDENRPPSSLSSDESHSFAT